MKQLHPGPRAASGHLVLLLVDLVAVTAAADPEDPAGLPMGDPAVTLGDIMDPYVLTGEALALPVMAVAEIRAQEAQAGWTLIVLVTTCLRLSSK